MQESPRELTLLERIELCYALYPTFDILEFGLGVPSMSEKFWHKMIDDYYPVAKFDTELKSGSVCS